LTKKTQINNKVRRRKGVPSKKSDKLRPNKPNYQRKQRRNK